ncbi:MAG: DUF4407 domain-containing protein [Bacteroidota bacterium]
MPPAPAPGFPPFYRYFCWCAGANLEVLRRYPTEYNKFFGIGAAVFMTAVFALLSSTYALTEVFQDTATGESDYLLIMPVSVTWSAFIFFLDRFLVSSINKLESGWRQFGMAFPRVLLAILIAIVIARPLELRICKEEIWEELYKEREKEKVENDSLYNIYLADLDSTTIIRVENANPHTSKLNDEIADLQKQIEVARAPLQAAEDSLAREINGTGGSRKRGCGPACENLKNSVRQKKDIYDEERKKLNAEIESRRQTLLLYVDNTKIDAAEIKKEVEKKRASLMADWKRREEEIMNQKANSLLAQNRIIGKLSEDSSVFMMMLAITLLFVFLETAPILVKLFTSAGPYETAIAQLEHQAESDIRQQRVLTRREFNVNTNLLNQMARSQSELISQELRNWTEKQMNNLRHRQDGLEEEEYNSTEI